MENPGITRKTVSRYLEITFTALVATAAVQGITEDWRLAFPCFVVGLYWFVTNHHNNKLIISFAVYAFSVAVLMYYFDKGPTERINCTFADNYLDCLKNSEPTFVKISGIQSVIWIFGGFLVYMSQQYRSKK